MLEKNFGPKIRQYAIVITVNFSMLWSGMSLGWSSPILVKLAKATETVLDSPLSDSDASWIVSSTFLTIAFATLMAPYLLNNIGRKYSVILSAIPHIIGSIIFVFAKTVWLFILARVLVGVSLAWCFIATPTYAAEIASKEIRGSLGTILQIFFCTGVTVMLSIGPFVPYMALNLIYGSVVLLTSIPMFFLPDTPYYLYSKGRTDEALKILNKLRGSELLAKEEIVEYKNTKTDTELDILSLLKDLIFLKTIFLVIIFTILYHLNGSSAIEFYLQPILKSTKTNVSSEIASAVIGLIKLIGGIFTATITDRFGRKPILIWAYFGMAVGMVGFGTYFSVSSETKQLYTFINYIPMICLILNIYCYSAGPGSLFNIIVPELFEGPSRALGVFVAVFVSALSMFITSKYLAAVLILVGPAVTYWCFGVICIINIMFVKFGLPETKGKSFADIQKILGRKTRN